MSIVRDECNERQTRIDGMIAEFRRAQSRRARATTVKGDGQAVQVQPEADPVFAVAVSNTPNTSH
jgi:hypothetical protein